MVSRALAGVLLVAAGAGLAGAQTYATSVEAVLQGPHWTGAPVSLARSNPLSSLGAPDGPATGTFFSLGFGGEITLGFGTDFTGPITIWETTIGTIASHPESANIFVGYGQSPGTAEYWLVTNLSNILPPAPISLDGVNLISGRSVYNFVRIVDTSNRNLLPTNSDGFDVDAVSVTPIPAPGSVALVGAAALVGLRRRRR